MTEPLALVSLAMGAYGGQLDGLPANALVAAGHTLLRRHAPIALALTKGAPAICLPPGAPFLTALAASDGHGALLIDPDSSDASLESLLASANVAVVFTLERYADRVPPALIRVLLDGVPRMARIRGPQGDRDIDLGAHTGVVLEGARDAEGRNEPCLRLGDEWLTHRELLHEARAIAFADTSSPLATSWSRDTLVTLVARLTRAPAATNG
jgi:hypothetical protein